MSILDTYFAILSQKETQSLKNLITDDVTFEGPFFKANGAKEFVEGMQKWIQLKKSYAMQQQFVNENSTCSLYEVTVTSPSGTTLTIPMADYIELREGKIAKERVYFDPTAWAKAMGK